MGDVKFVRLVYTLHHSFAMVQAKKPGDTMRDMEAEAFVDRLAEVKTDTLSEVVTKTIAITITCVKVEAPVKTDGDIDVGLKACTAVDTINEFKPVPLVHPKAYTFS